MPAFLDQVISRTKTGHQYPDTDQFQVEREIAWIAGIEEEHFPCNGNHCEQDHDLDMDGILREIRLDGVEELDCDKDEEESSEQAINSFASRLCENNFVAGSGTDLPHLAPRQESGS